MVPFTIKQLEIFVTVAHKLSYTKAAKELHLTQPALSRQIANLEYVCGFKVFEQIGKQIYLTDKGKRFLIQVEKLLGEFEDMSNIMNDDVKPMVGKLKFCIAEPILHLIFDVVGKFNKLYPSVDFQISLSKNSRNYQLDLLYNNDVDFCLMGLPNQKLGLTAEFINKFPMSVVASPDHPLANERSLHPKVLKDEKFFVANPDSANARHTHQLLKNIRSNNNPQQIDSQEAIKFAVRANLGLALLPDFIMQLELKYKMLHALSFNKPLNIFAEVYWVQHINKEQSALTESFKGFLLNQMSKAKR